MPCEQEKYQIFQLVGLVRPRRPGAPSRTGERIDCHRRAKAARARGRQAAPADEIDPAYGAALREAAAGGVELLAYSARVRPDRLEIHRRIPVTL